MKQKTEHDVRQERILDILGLKSQRLQIIKDAQQIQRDIVFLTELVERMNRSPMKWEVLPSRSVFWSRLAKDSVRCYRSFDDWEMLLICELIANELFKRLCVQDPSREYFDIACEYAPTFEWYTGLELFSTLSTSSSSGVWNNQFETNIQKFRAEDKAHETPHHE